MHAVTRILLAFIAASCSANEPIHESRFIMGTLVDFVVYAEDREQATSAIAAASQEMRRIDREFTLYGKRTNGVKRFNASQPGTTVVLPKEADALLVRAMEIARASEGAFDPAIGGLTLLWGFSLPDPPKTPPPQQNLQQALKGVSFLMIRKQDEGWMRMHAETKLDLGGMAKGYAVDRAVQILTSMGIRNAIVNAGGDLRAIGRRVDRAWRIGIRHPRKPSEVIGWIEADGDVSVATSGDYQRFFMYHGKRLHHILDPKTGWPAGTAISATVIAKTAAEADAWATALFVMGVEGLKRLERLGLPALLVDPQGSIHLNQPMKKRFHPSIKTSIS